MRKHLSRSIVWWTAVRLLIDVVRFVSVGFRSRSQLAAENLFLLKLMVLYRARQVKPRRAPRSISLARPRGHQVPDGHRVIAASIMVGLHHAYRLDPLAA